MRWLGWMLWTTAAGLALLMAWGCSGARASLGTSLLLITVWFTPSTITLLPGSPESRRIKNWDFPKGLLLVLLLSGVLVLWWIGDNGQAIPFYQHVLLSGFWACVQLWRLWRWYLKPTATHEASGNAEAIP